MSDSGSEFPPEVLERINRARAVRSAVQARDPTFFAAVSKAMFERDPMGINFTDNTDEYDAEAGTVIPRLAACRSIEEVAQVLLATFPPIALSPRTSGFSTDAVMHNTSAHTDKQHQVAAARRMLRAGGLQRLTTALERCESRLSVC
jgi:hypothetical protein